MNACKLGKCDGSGMVDIYLLKTIIRFTGGGCRVKRERVTRDQAETLKAKVDWKDQTIETAAAACECRSIVE